MKTPVCICRWICSVDILGDTRVSGFQLVKRGYKEIINELLYLHLLFQQSGYHRNEHKGGFMKILQRTCFIENKAGCTTYYYM